MTAIEARPEAGGGDRIEHSVRVAVVGAGFSGLSVATRLRESGEKDFVVLGRAKSVGGVCRNNTSPGAASNVPPHLSSLPSAPNPGGSRSSPRGSRSGVTSSRWPTNGA